MLQEDDFVKKILVFLVLIVSMTAFSYIGMLSDFNTALKLASIQEKEAIVMFSDRNCSYCVKFEKETLQDNEVQQILKAGYVFAQIYKFNTDKATFPITGEGTVYSYPDLYTHFGIRGTPTFWFFTTEGSPLTNLPGYVGAKDFIPIVRFLGEKAYSSMSFEDYRGKPSSYVGTEKIVRVNQEDYDFVLANDPLAAEYTGQDIDVFTVWLSKDQATAEELLSAGVYRVILLN